MWRIALRRMFLLTGSTSLIERNTQTKLLSFVALGKTATNSQCTISAILLSRVNNRRESILLQYTRQGHSRESNVTSTQAN